MRILLTIICFVLGMLVLNGRPKSMNHLFKDQGKDISPFFNPTCQLTEVVGGFSIIPGLRTGVIFNKNIALGALYNFSLTDINLPKIKGGGKMGMKWGGFYFEYILWPLQTVHLTIPVSIGTGQLNLGDTTLLTGEVLTYNPNFMFAEPGFVLEANIWKYAKLGIGGSYRYTTNAANLLRAYDLSGLAFTVSVKFGLFDYEETKREREGMKGLKDQNRIELRNEKKIKSNNEKLDKKINGGNNKRENKENNR